MLPLSVYLLTQGIPSVIYIISNTQNEIPDIHLQSVTALISKSKKKSRKTGQDQKTLIYAFASLLTATAKN